jgi:predicted amidophosphoribosyltransferase
LNGPRLRQIDEQSRADHVRLAPDDACYFLYEYTSGQGYSFSATNSLISNLKKKLGTTGYQYKLQAITHSARELANAINSEWLDGATLVPVPPSKARGDPAYDDRMTKVCQGIRAGLDVRELVVQSESLPAAHESKDRPTVVDLLRVWSIDEQLANPSPRWIGIFDDVLTTGTRFVAMKTILQGHFPQVHIFGFFIARRVFPPSDEQSSTVSLF